MTITTLQAAKALGEFANWRLTNLQMQKILYIAHMFHLGRHGTPLVNEAFEAWDYGPVLPNLYHEVKFFGSSPIKDVFFGTTIPEKGTELKILQQAADKFSNVKAGSLVAATHRPEGAWSKNYKEGIKNQIIPNKDILEEYKKL